MQIMKKTLISAALLLAAAPAFAYYDNAGSSILATRYGLLAVSLLGLLAAVLIVVQSLRLLTSARRTLHAAARPVPIASDSRRFRHATRRVRL